MSETKKFTLDMSSNFLIIQTSLLVLYYGFNIILPFWVLWFPIIFTLCILIGFLIVIIIIGVIQALIEG